MCSFRFDCDIISIYLRVLNKDIVLLGLVFRKLTRVYFPHIKAFSPHDNALLRY